MKPSRASWKLPVACAVAITAVLRFGAPTIIPAAPTPAPSTPAAPAPDDAAAVARLKTADELFAYIKEQVNSQVADPDETLPREQQIAQLHQQVDQKVARLRPAFDAFLARYPQDPRRWEVKLQRLYFLDISGDESVATLKAVIAAPDASPQARHRARAVLLQSELEEADPGAGLTPALEKRMADYEKDFPDDESGKDLVELRVRLLQASAPGELASTLEALSKSPNKSTAESAGNQLALLTRPVELQFDSATDGEPVDVSRLRGKVVLLDFWATWCGPCMAKLPEIQKLNEKYRDKDFQLIGISLDQDKAALLKTARARNMDWPEYFDGKGWGSAVGTRFGVHSIPAAWLLDKKGLAHAVPREADLDAEIARLIDEKP